MAGTQKIQQAAALLAVLLLRLSTASELQARHIELTSPKPFTPNDFGFLNPLKPDGSDFPCKVTQGGKFTIDGSPTEMVVGEQQSASFKGTAVHGGGSCQFALAEGLEPTKDSVWKVIHSIEGGCPKANIEGNLQEGQSPDSYPFTIPDDFAEGEYTFAWTWVNRIGGQPEFYMNCAPIKVKAASGSTQRVRERRAAHDRRQPSYPDLFLANIGQASGGCDTSEALGKQVAIQYPSPGDSVSFPNGEGKLFKQPCDGNPRNGGGGQGGSSPSGTGGAGSAAATGAGSGASGAPAPTAVLARAPAPHGADGTRRNGAPSGGPRPTGSMLTGFGATRTAGGRPSRTGSPGHDCKNSGPQMCMGWRGGRGRFPHGREPVQRV